MKEVAAYLPVPRTLRKWRCLRRVQEVFISTPTQMPGGLGSSRQGGQYWFLAGLPSHVPSGWLGTRCWVNPLSTCQTSAYAETVAGASRH